MTATAGFTTDSSCQNVTITAGQKLKCSITFAPTAVGSVSGAALTLDSNANDSPTTISLSGNGVQTIFKTSSRSLHFSRVAVGTNASKSVRLISHTDATLTSRASARATRLSRPLKTCVGPLTKTDCSINVVLTPSATGNVSDVLTINDTLDGITKTVKLIGIGK